MSTFAPAFAAATKLSGLPAIVTQTGSSFWTGRGRIRVSTVSPAPLTKGSDSPRHKRRHGVDLLEHQILALLEGVWLQDEVVRLPSRRERDRDAAVREVIDDRPFLRDAQHRVQRADDAAGADADLFRDRGDGGARDRRIREQAAEGVEVTFRRPHGDEVVLVGEPRAIEQQAVLVLFVLALVAGEVEQAEVDRALRRGDGDERLALFVAMEHDGEAARQRPQQLEHRDVEAEAGDGEPRLLFATARVDHLVHPDLEVRDVAVLDHHALRAAGGARRIDHVREIGRARRAIERLRGSGGADREVGIDRDDLGRSRGDARAQAFFRQDDAELRHPRP